MELITISLTAGEEEGQAARWGLFHSALHKGMTCDLGAVSSNRGSSRKESRIREGLSRTWG